MPARLPDSQDTTPSNGRRGRPITSALLSAASLVKVDKSHVLSSYLSSQRSYRTHFVKEGQKDWVAFDKPAESRSGSGGNEESEQKQDVQDAGFSTPKLKARVPNPPGTEDKASLKHDGAPEQDVPQSSSRPSEDRTQRRIAATKKTEEKQAVNKSRKLEDYLLAQRQPEKSKSRKRQRSVESEREASTWS